MNGFEDRMAQLRARFVTRATRERDELKAARTRGDRQEMRRLAHSLSGAGGLFGFPDISEAAEQLERAIDRGEEGAALQTHAGLLLDRLTLVG